MTLPPTDVVIRRARTADVKAIRGFVDAYAPERKLLNKPTVTLYEDVQEFWVAEQSTGDAPPVVVGCGALHVMWEDLAEVRTLAVDPAMRAKGIGSSAIGSIATHRARAWCASTVLFDL